MLKRWLRLCVCICGLVLVVGMCHSWVKKSKIFKSRVVEPTSAVVWLWNFSSLTIFPTPTDPCRIENEQLFLPFVGSRINGWRMDTSRFQRIPRRAFHPISRKHRHLWGSTQTRPRLEPSIAQSRTLFQALVVVLQTMLMSRAFRIWFHNVCFVANMILLILYPYELRVDTNSICLHHGSQKPSTQTVELA